ncbi:hypothetical protein H5410_034907 [Solanum commersonii]|uniref:Uncharacterized protein n=1 Tax=Solanum commersonii TaxID=4109 RepID=A0A9J5XZ90_SOLCO|nr:hypothetical protein H5410_034907 [Solanum commersonii]
MSVMRLGEHISKEVLINLELASFLKMKAFIKVEVKHFQRCSQSQRRSVKI